MTGAREPKRWTGGGEKLDFFDLKGAVENLLTAMRVSGAQFRPEEHPPLHPASSSMLSIGGKPAGALGQIHPRVAAHFDVPPETWTAELDWELLAGQAPGLPQSSGIPRFPAIARDLAFVVDAKVSAEQLLREIHGVDSARLLEHVAIFDVYRGPPVPEGKKSIAFGLSLRAPDRTLTDAEADALCGAIRDRLKMRFGAGIRA